jgi:frataxin-like iron-binding protein CyaY
MTMKKTPTTLVIIVMVINRTMPMKEVTIATMELGYHNHERSVNKNNDNIKQP